MARAYLHSAHTVHAAAALATGGPKMQRKGVGADEEGQGDHYLLAMPHNCFALHAVEWVPKQVPMQEP